MKGMEAGMKIQSRERMVVNTDPQRRCYDGCHFSSEEIWSDWMDLETLRLGHEPESRLQFWRELNDYAVQERGGSARKEFRVVA